MKKLKKMVAMLMVAIFAIMIAPATSQVEAAELSTFSASQELSNHNKDWQKRRQDRRNRRNRREYESARAYSLGIRDGFYDGYNGLIYGNSFRYFSSRHEQEEYYEGYIYGYNDGAFQRGLN